MRKLFALTLLLGVAINISAQRFFNLSAADVSVDSVMPEFTYTIPLEGNYRDSIYTATIVYPEFVDMTAEDIAAYHRLTSALLPSMPAVESLLTFNRKRPSLRNSFCPLVYRDGKYQAIASFMLRIDAKPARGRRRAAAKAPDNPADRYVGQSVLRSGSWAKIRVPQTGVYQITDELVRQAGFTDPSKVKVYGFGGNLLNEQLSGESLMSTDDLKEVPTCTVNGKRLFYALGPVSWASNEAARRTRNPYSDYGYYFLTSNDDAPLTVDESAFLSSFYPSAVDYHTLHEVDRFSWMQGGRNLFDPQEITSGHPQTVTIAHPANATSGRLSVNVTAGSASVAQVSVNDSVVGTIRISYNSNYDHGNENSGTYAIAAGSGDLNVTISLVSGGPLHLDYVSAAWDAPFPAPDLNGTFSAPQYVHNITNQNHHADPQADMVIIVPTSQVLMQQAQRLARHHEQADSMRVNIVPADELYNEFSSGTPDAGAYRNYMKMLYDRAQTEEDQPKYLLLFGDCVWDSRMLTADCQNLNPDNYLLCHESENSFNEITCYVDDGFFCCLDDGEGIDPRRTDQGDVAVGRFPVTTEAEAKVVVDKTISYVENRNAGDWQNTLVFMGDDGNGNIHMRDENETAETIARLYPGYRIKKVMWDAYTNVTTATGNTYPEITAIVKRQQSQGALIMDYAGHGRADQISHEKVLSLNDFKEFTNQNLPLWITASCDIMPFDGTGETIGEAALLNAKGGAVAFFGTTRTVYASQNKSINMAYLRYVLSDIDGKPVSIGEAQRLAKNYMITSGQDRTENKMQYSLLGDPAIVLRRPTRRIVVDAINGRQPTDLEQPTLAPASVVTVEGHVEGVENYNGTISATVLDSRELITCKVNKSALMDGNVSAPFQFYDRSKTLFNGTDSIANGRFSFSFAVPQDLNYAGQTGKMTLYAVNSDHTIEANGEEENFIAGGDGTLQNDSTGPRIYCYLNSSTFTDGGDVNVTPYFVARVSDPDGLNTTGNGVGHDMELIIDGDATKTYNLNDNFAYDFGSYTSGQTYYSIPELEPGRHSLTFRVWDVLNNSSTATLTFNVVKSLEPTIYNVSVTNNPATASTTFIVNHSLNNSSVDVIIDVFDASGRLLWSHSDAGVSVAGPYTYTWNLTQDGGGQLQTGVYLYRVRLASDGSSFASKAKKLVVINNN